MQLSFEKKRITIFRGWWMVAVSILGLTFSIGPVLVLDFGIFVKPFVSTFSASRGSVSLSILMLNLGAMLSLPVAGRLMDLYGVRRVTTVSIILFAICLFGLSAVSSAIWQLHLLYGLAGITAAGTTPVAFAKLIANWFNKKRGLALGISSTGIGLGGFFMPVLAQYLINIVGWRQTFQVMGGLCLLVIAPLLCIIIRNRPEELGLVPDGSFITLPLKEPQAHLKNRSIKEVFGTSTFWILAMIYFSVAACAVGFATHLSPLLTDKGFNKETAAFVTSLFGLSSIGGRILSGFFVDKFFAPKVAAITLAAAATGMAIVWTGPGLPGLVMGTLLIGLAQGGEADVMPYLISRYFGRSRMGVSYGIIFAIFTVGVALGTYFFGHIFDTRGSYQTALAVSFLVFIATFFLTFLLGRYSDNVLETD